MIKAIEGGTLLMWVRDVKQETELSPSPTAWFKVRGEMIAKKEKNGILLLSKGKIDFH